MARQNFRIEGDQELIRALQDVSKATGRAILRRVLTNAAKPLVQKAKAYAPMDTGALEGSIRSGITAVGADPGKSAFASVLGSGGSRGEAVSAMRAARRSGTNSFAEIYVGPGRHPQAIQQEFGNVNHGPDPFMRPAWDETKGGMTPEMGRAIWTEIEKTAARKARREAKKG